MPASIMCDFGNCTNTMERGKRKILVTTVASNGYVTRGNFCCEDHAARWLARMVRLGPPTDIGAEIAAQNEYVERLKIEVAQERERAKLAELRLREFTREAEAEIKHVASRGAPDFYRTLARSIYDHEPTEEQVERVRAEYARFQQQGGTPHWRVVECEVEEDETAQQQEEYERR